MADACARPLFEQRDISEEVLENIGLEVAELFRNSGHECWSSEVVQIGDKIVVRPRLYS